MRILVVEDQAQVAEFVAKGLRAAGYETQTVASGGAALEHALGPFEYDLIILDLGLPDMSGFDVLEAVRKEDSSIPVVVLTASGDVPSRIRGLDLGADDYLPKPFDFGELLARIRARLRDMGQPSSSVLTVGDLSLDLRSRRVAVGDRVLDLTSREFALLEFLMRHPGQVLSRDQLLDGVWGYDYDVASNVIDVYISYLRSKLDDREGHRIETVRGGGYRLHNPGRDGG